MIQKYFSIPEVWTFKVFEKYSLSTFGIITITRKVLGLSIIWHVTLNISEKSYASLMSATIWEQWTDAPRQDW